MRCTVRVSLSFALLSSFALACDSGGGGPDSSIKTHPDSGTMNPADTGVMGTPDTGDMNPADSGVTTLPDSGVVNPGACDPVALSGCMAPDTCIVPATMGTLAPQCRMAAAMPVAFEQTCNPALANCAPGYACLQFQGEMGMPACRKVCHANNNADCAGLMGASPSYSCLIPFSADYGLCAPTPTACVPYMDMCPAMQYCQILPNNMTGCIPEGTANVGEACGMTACKKGGICLNLQGTAGAQCYQPCDPNTAMSCGANAACGGLQGLSFGLCRMSTSCTPVMDMCPMGEACAQVAQGQFGCAPEGAQPNQPCPMGACTKGYLCVGPSQMAATCKQACDMTHACPMMGMCQMLQGLPVGVCP
jgi:hypothetical protein